LLARLWAALLSIAFGRKDHPSPSVKTTNDLLDAGIDPIFIYHHSHTSHSTQ